eukprot:TRINITY_DN23033_c0_g3_i1.p1 TRINITY_DN23033_c0_g3~~TRINITY_DN23033_c0_g3_i1.p1  ORF type:complete len:589 (-),score=142.57 TRINITY_DN23033_c0_g3_i1:64-1830(-)
MLLLSVLYFFLAEWPSFGVRPRTQGLLDVEQVAHLERDEYLRRLHLSFSPAAGVPEPASFLELQDVSASASASGSASAAGASGDASAGSTAGAGAGFSAAGSDGAASASAGARTGAGAAGSLGGRAGAGAGAGAGDASGGGVLGTLRSWVRAALGSGARKLGQLEYTPAASCSVEMLRPLTRMTRDEVAGIPDVSKHLYEQGPIVVTNGFAAPAGLDGIFTDMDARVHFDNFHSEVEKLLKAYGFDGFLEEIALEQHNMTLAQLLHVTTQGMTIGEYAAYVERVKSLEARGADRRAAALKEAEERRNRRLEAWIPPPSDLAERLGVSLADPFPHFFAKLEDVFARPLYSHDFPTLALREPFIDSLKRRMRQMRLDDFIRGEGSKCVDLAPNSEVSCAPSLFWGGPRTHAYPLHRNVHENDIAKFQIKGRTRVALFHPSEADRLYPLRISQWKFQVYMSNAFAKWPCDEYPFFSGAQGVLDVLNEGDILLFSGRWIHDFENLEEAMSVIVANVTNGFVPYKADKYTLEATHVVRSALIEGFDVSYPLVAFGLVFFLLLIAILYMQFGHIVRRKQITQNYPFIPRRPSAR